MGVRKMIRIAPADNGAHCLALSNFLDLQNELRASEKSAEKLNSEKTKNAVVFEPLEVLLNLA